MPPRLPPCNCIQPPPQPSELLANAKAINIPSLALIPPQPPGLLLAACRLFRSALGRDLKHLDTSIVNDGVPFPIANVLAAKDPS